MLGQLYTIQVSLLRLLQRRRQTSHPFAQAATVKPQMAAALQQLMKWNQICLPPLLSSLLMYAARAQPNGQMGSGFALQVALQLLVQFQDWLQDHLDQQLQGVMFSLKA
jgi:hypothetical protein